jgi:hypothetical protein
MIINTASPNSGPGGTAVTYSGLNLGSVTLAVFVDSNNNKNQSPALATGGGTGAIAVVPAGMTAGNGQTWLESRGVPTNSLSFTFTT